MINWAYFPRNARPSEFCRQIVDCFQNVATIIDSEANDARIGADYKDATSDKVLAAVRPELELLGFQVEKSKTAAGRIAVPVLFGRNGKPLKSFFADAYHPSEHFVLEVEAGRGVGNYQFLKDLFQASVMTEVDYLGIAVRNVYKKSKDFEIVYDFFDTLFTSGRLQLPLRGILLIGY